MTPEGQKALLTVWANSTNFVLDFEKQPKAEFARLAQVKGWTGGDADWCMYWKTCFGEVYSYGARTTTNMTTNNMSTTPTATDLVDRMRRLSVGSDASSFSIVSAAPSVKSLDSNGSLAGGVGISKVHQLASPSEDRRQDSSQGSAPKSAGLSRAAQPASSLPKASLFWNQFPGFVPDPAATFKDEFARLAKHQAWSTKTKRKRQVEALNAEVAFHYGTCMQKLDRWQELCEEVGIEKIPTSITQCKKALQSVFVNLFNLIDHRRNPDVKIVHFKSYNEFSRNVCAGNKFPRQCAKQDGFIRVLLKKL